MLVEVCANSLESAINAEKGGADRIELCSELGVGGITPSFGLIEAVLQNIQIPVHVLIRPRSGNFTYSDFEFDVMIKDIEKCKDIGVKGIVSGALKHREIDPEKTEKLKKASGNLNFTFHRAFDWVEDQLRSLQILENIGVDTILTSGGENHVDSGFAMLIKLHENSKNCMIMPGSGVNLENIQKFKNSGFQAIHFSASKFIQTTEHRIPVPLNSEKFLQEHMKTISDVRIVEEMVQKLK